MKTKVLIIGSFNSGAQVIYGGIEKSCRILLNSPFAKKFEVSTLDSSQANNPPPNIFIRTKFSFIRFLKLIDILIRKRPEVALVFCSGGLSFFEKSLMCILIRVAGCRALIFPSMKIG